MALSACATESSPFPSPFKEAACAVQDQSPWSEYSQTRSQPSGVPSLAWEDRDGVVGGERFSSHSLVALFLALWEAGCSVSSRWFCQGIQYQRAFSTSKNVFHSHAMLLPLPGPGLKCPDSNPSKGSINQGTCN